MEKIKIIGIIEIALAVILLAGAIVGGLLASKSISDLANGQSRILGTWQTEINSNETKNIFDNETKSILNFDIIGMSVNLGWGLIETNMLIICSAIILGAIALLMLFDGINKFNLQKK